MKSSADYLREKCEAIQAIQRRGYRVLCLRRGGVQIWKKGDDNNFRHFRDLPEALAWAKYSRDWGYVK